MGNDTGFKGEFNFEGEFAEAIEQSNLTEEQFDEKIQIDYENMKKKWKKIIKQSKINIPYECDWELDGYILKPIKNHRGGPDGFVHWLLLIIYEVFVPNNISIATSTMSYWDDWTCGSFSIDPTCIQILCTNTYGGELYNQITIVPILDCKTEEEIKASVLKTYYDSENYIKESLLKASNEKNIEYEKIIKFYEDSLELHPDGHKIIELKKHFLQIANQ